MRSDQRGKYSQPVRISLLESDMDEREDFEVRILKELAGIRRTLFGLLTTVLGATVAALLARWPK